MDNNEKKEPRIVFWSIIAVGMWYMYNNVFKK